MGFFFGKALIMIQDIERLISRLANFKEKKARDKLAVLIEKAIKNLENQIGKAIAEGKLLPYQAETLADRIGELEKELEEERKN